MNSQEQRNNILKVYLDNILKPKKNEALELETKFGTIPGIKPITRIDYENVIKKIKSSGFILKDLFPTFIVRGIVVPLFETKP